MGEVLRRGRAGKRPGGRNCEGSSATRLPFWHEELYSSRSSASPASVTRTGRCLD